MDWVLPDQLLPVGSGLHEQYLLFCLVWFFFPVIANNVRTVYGCDRIVIVFPAAEFDSPLCFHGTSGEAVKSPRWVAVPWLTCPITYSSWHGHLDLEPTGWRF